MTKQDKKIRCQSCAMPLAAGFFGTNKNGLTNKEYCRFCFQRGEFTAPELTMNQMIQRSIDHMREELKLSEQEAHKLANQFIPRLKRWSW